MGSLYRYRRGRQGASIKKDERITKLNTVTASGLGMAIG